MYCLMASHGGALLRAILRAPSRTPRPHPQDGARMKLSFLDIKNARRRTGRIAFPTATLSVCKSGRTATSSGRSGGRKSAAGKRIAALSGRERFGAAARRNWRGIRRPFDSSRERRL
jgi:hypothetical protein